MTFVENLSRDFVEPVVSPKHDATGAARQTKRREKLEAEGKVSISGYISSESKVFLNLLLMHRKDMKRAEYIELLIEREFKRKFQPIYQKIIRTIDESGYNNLEEKTGLSQEILERLKEINAAQILKSNRKHKKSAHQTDQPGINEKFDEMQF